MWVNADDVIVWNAHFSASTSAPSCEICDRQAVGLVSRGELVHGVFGDGLVHRTRERGSKVATEQQLVGASRVAAADGLPDKRPRAHDT
ncbi:unnamed protein product, partial [Iphiclides podalirius]